MITSILTVSGYILGMVLTPVIIGVLCGCRGKSDILDVGIPLFLSSLFWPIVLGLILIFVLAIVLTWIPGWLFGKLFDFGCRISGYIDRMVSKRSLHD